MPRHALAPAEVIPFSPSDLPIVGTPRGDIAEMADYVLYQESLPDGEYDPDKADFAHELMLRRVDQFRDELHGLSADEQKRLAPYIQSLIPHDAGADAGLPTVKTLEHMDVEGIIDFSRRHTAILKQLRSDAAPFIQSERHKFLDGLEAGIDVGWISPSAISMEKEILHMPVDIGDWWQTQMRRQRGFFDCDTRSIMLSQSLGTTPEDRLASFKTMHAETVSHEFWHLRDVSMRAKDFWVVEAGAEHAALSMSHGEPQTLSPEARKHDSRIYVGYRSLAAEMMRGTDDPFLFTRMATSGSLDSPEAYDLNETLYDKYGVDDVVARVSDRIVKYEEQNPGVDQDRLALAVAKELREKPWLVFGVTAQHFGRYGRFITSAAASPHLN